MARTHHSQPEELGLSAVLLVFTQREGRRLEPQARVPHLPRATAESGDQAEKADRAQEAGTARGTRSDQPDLVYGFCVRRFTGWANVPVAQCDR